jgi:hypothetical protein
MTMLMTFGLGALFGGYRVEMNVIEPAAAGVGSPSLTDLCVSPTRGDVGGDRGSYVGGAAERPQEDGMADRPTVLGVATYSDKHAAMADFRAVWAVHQEGERGLVAAAVLAKGIDGKLHLDLHDTTTTRRAWGGALVGGALAVVATPLAIAPLSVAATEDGTWAGVGGIVGHFWNNIPKHQLVRMSDLLESGQAALVVVAVDHPEAGIEALMHHATERIVTETDGGDVELAYDDALAQERQEI